MTTGPRPSADTSAGTTAPAFCPPRFGFRVRALLLVLGIMALVLGAASVGAIYRMREQILVAQERSTQATANGLALAAQVAMFAGDKPELQRLAEQASQQPDVASVTILDPQGNPVASAPRPPASGAPGASPTEPAAAFVVASAAIEPISASADDLGIIDSNRGPSDPSSRSIGTARIATSKTRLHDEVRRQTLALAGLFGTTALAGCLVIWLAVGRWTQRLSSLAKASVRIARGGLGEPLRDPRHDEIGQLVKAFDYMRGNLHLREQEAADLNNRLEHRVQEQTRALRERQAELESALSMAEAANRAKTDFLANMSHEIRTPMTAILGYADLLADPGQPEEQRETCIETIRRSGDHLMAILNEILDLSKIEAGQFTLRLDRVAVSNVLCEAVSMMRPRASAADLSLDLKFDGPIPATILADPVRLRQILINLVGNAIKFTHTGGVTIRCGMETSGGENLLRITVEDTGIGMSDEQVARLFRPFTQADESMSRRYGGTGLGLVISKRLAELMGGTIRCQSRSGVGSTFVVTLSPGPLQGVPMLDGLTEAIAAPQRQAHIAQSDAITVAGRVLLVEDGTDNQRLIAFHLKKAGAEVAIAENGRKGLDEALRAMKAGTPYDLILMDMQMPEMDGYTATRELRKAGYDLPICALTAHAMSGDSEKCIQAGCDGYATKPIDRTKLLEAVRDWIDKAHSGWRSPRALPAEQPAAHRAA